MKRIIALLLVLALAVPITAYATEPSAAPELETTVEPESVPETTVTEETLDIDSIAPYVVASAGAYVFAASGSQFWNLDGLLEDGKYIIAAEDLRSEPISIVFTPGADETNPDVLSFRGDIVFSDGEDSLSVEIFLMQLNGFTHCSLIQDGVVVDPLSTFPELCFNVVNEDTNDSNGMMPYVVVMADYLRLIAGCVVFLTVVVLCVFVYKFFRMFF